MRVVTQKRCHYMCCSTSYEDRCVRMVADARGASRSLARLLRALRMGSERAAIGRHSVVRRDMLYVRRVRLQRRNLSIMMKIDLPIHVHTVHNNTQLRPPLMLP